MSNRSTRSHFKRDYDKGNKGHLIVFIFISALQQISLGLSQADFGLQSDAFGWITFLTIGLD